MVTVLERYLGQDRLRLIDVGARYGLDHRWARFERVLEVTAFEPDRTECERLIRVAGLLPYPARFLPHALWREASDSVPFHVCNWPVASSIYPPNDDFLRLFPAARQLFGVKEVQTIRTVTLDEILRQESLGVDYIKIDVEGAELDVIVGGEAAMREALVLEVEVELNPIFRDQPLFADVDRHLRERGWVLLGLRRNSWRREAGLDRSASGDGGQIVSADALYCNRGTLKDGKLPLRRELKFLVILAAYMQSDLVRDRLQGSSVLAAQLSTPELRELETLLAPKPSLARRLTRRALRRLDAERRRAIADSLQQGDATVWHDPHFF